MHCKILSKKTLVDEWGQKVAEGYLLGLVKHEVKIAQRRLVVVGMEEGVHDVMQWVMSL